MRKTNIFVFVLLVILACNVTCSRSLIDPRLFDTVAKFSIDEDVKMLSSVIATIEEHPAHGPEHLWLQINYYSFALTAEEVEEAASGNFDLITNRRYEEDYDSQAIILISMTRDYKVWQIDISMPGVTCTIAWLDEDVKSFLQTFQYEDDNLMLKAEGSYTCGTPVNKTLSWLTDIEIPVFGQE